MSEPTNLDLLKAIHHIEMTFTQKLEAIHQSAIAAVPLSRRSNRVMTGEFQEIRDLRQQREDEVVRIFLTLARMDRKRKLAQTFNKGIVQSTVIDRTPYELVPRSILRNRCALRKVFSPVEGEGEKDADSNVVVALDSLIKKGALRELAMFEATCRGRQHHSQTRVVASVKEYDAIRIYLNMADSVDNNTGPTAEQVAAEKAAAEKLRMEQDERAQREGLATLDEDETPHFELRGENTVHHPSDAEFDMTPIGEEPDVVEAVKKADVPFVEDTFGADEPTDEELEAEFGETSTWSLKR